MAELAITAVGLTKTHCSASGPVPAVRGIDLEIGAGELFGLLGPNGAGKSTTIGMLTTLMVPTAGHASVAGIDVARHPTSVKRHIGVVSQKNTLDRELSVAENLEFRGRFFGMRGRQARRRSHELLGLFDLQGRSRAMVHELSGGQTKRLLVARAMIHRPEVLFLDEPTSSIDPQSRVNLWDTFREMNKEGQTIMLTTQHMEEAEVLCQRVAIMDHGRVLTSGSVPDLTAAATADTIITVVYDGPAPNLNEIRDMAGVHEVQVESDRVHVFARSARAVLNRLIRAGSTAGLGLLDASIRRPSLESVFLELTGRGYRE